MVIGVKTPRCRAYFAEIEATDVAITEARDRGGVENPRGLTEHVAGPGSRGSPRQGRARDRPSLPRVGQYSLPSSVIRVFMH